MKKKYIHQTLKLLFAGLVLVISQSCQKIDYQAIDNPSYLRVFNSINVLADIANKGVNEPYLCMLIEPEFDANQVPVSAKIVGDHLRVRDKYAPPYPSALGASTSLENPEYPGKETVLVAPVINGFDLSSWAQVPSGKVRVAFYYRPRNEQSFFQLEERFKRNVLLDTILNLDPLGVYTLHLLEKDFKTKERGMLLREENFHKQPFSDTLVYANFYNYSSDGYWQAPISEKVVNVDYRERNGNYFIQGLRDTMNVFMTLYSGPYNLSGGVRQILVSNDYVGRYMTTMHRTTSSSKVAPYTSFPLWANPMDDRIRTRMFQKFIFLSPGIVPYKDAYFGALDQVVNGGNMALAYFFKNSYDYENIDFDLNRLARPNLIVTTHSGLNNPQSFATVNTLELINGEMYLMTIQRRYAPPRLY